MQFTWLCDNLFYDSIHVCVLLQWLWFYGRCVPSMVTTHKQCHDVPCIVSAIGPVDRQLDRQSVAMWLIMQHEEVTQPWRSSGDRQGRQCALADIISVCWNVVDETSSCVGQEGCWKKARARIFLRITHQERLVSVIYVEYWTQSSHAELYQRQCGAAVPRRDSRSKWTSRSTSELGKHRDRRRYVASRREQRGSCESSLLWKLSVFVCIIHCTRPYNLAYQLQKTLLQTQNWMKALWEPLSQIMTLSNTC